MSVRRRRIWLWALAPLVLFLGAAACSGLPPLEPRTASTAPSDTADTRLGRGIEPRAARHPGLSGIYPLPDSREAFAARILLARAADRTLDVQYYIWKNDLSGTLLLEALHEAADRGVRVRLLLDDHGSPGLDAALAALAAHPWVEVRLFNPFARRGYLRWLGFLTDFPRLNRRMHNKSFTADNEATIIGGRNVGDEYFEATEGVVFVDLDALAVGPVVKEVSADFDRYWASASAYPAARILPPAAPDALERLEREASLIERDPRAAAYMEAIQSLPFVRQLVDGTLPLEWARTRMVSDDPAKALGGGDTQSFLPYLLGRVIGEPSSEVQLISAYFVPVESTALFVGMARRGVKVSILTNALEATDVPPVHAGYAKRRKALLRAGVRLYELRREAAGGGAHAGAGGGAFGSVGLGSSGSSLHAKTFAIDRARAFIGSFNFDPRSARLNTENGFVIDSPALARQVAAAFENRIPARSYEVRLAPGGELYWTERRDGRVVRHDAEPGTGFWLRFGIRVLSWLPIDWML